ncbi:hypothetical protein DVT68_02480 [Dyella solisilvae]|uniref:Uncharacterized protein n=1 Tax=Dyella solisilvae TaxID=1920168 RepID=A0A370KAP6_9GAMM|nr:hypothetical protein DVT68_02480 [Dyella solisilvae]
MASPITVSLCNRQFRDRTSQFDFCTNGGQRAKRLEHQEEATRLRVLPLDVIPAKAGIQRLSLLV